MAVTVIAVKCGCGETHRLLFSRTLATTFRKPPARTTDCRLPNGRAPKSAPTVAMTELEERPMEGELALAFC